MGLRIFGLVKVIFFFFFILMLLPYSSSAQSEKPRLNVDQLVDEALQNNPEISAAKIKWEVFKEKIPQSYALEDPMFGFGIVNLPTNFSFKEEDMTMPEVLVTRNVHAVGMDEYKGVKIINASEAVSTEI